MIDGREDVVLYVLSCKAGIEDKSLLFVDYYLTHVLVSLPAFVSQVHFSVNGLGLEGHSEVHIHPDALRSVSLPFCEAGNPLQASLPGAGVRHAAEPILAERRYADLRPVYLSSRLCPFRGCDHPLPQHRAFHHFRPVGLSYSSHHLVSRERSKCRTGATSRWRK